MNITIEDKENIYFIFSGSPYFPLDNYYLVPVEYEGLVYTNSEAAFQSAKLADINDRLDFTDMEPAYAKLVGKDYIMTPLRKDWEEVKDSIMYEIVKNKIKRNEFIKDLLLSTGSKTIYEGNCWNDLYWGVDLKTGKGKNMLGKILMKIREELR